MKLSSPGPVIFKQRRNGLDGEEIIVYKFRSMYVDQCDAGAARMVTRGDPRVTPVGRFIRKTSLDELPQLAAALHMGNGNFAPLANGVARRGLCVCARVCLLALPPPPHGRARTAQDDPPPPLPTAAPL